MTAHRLVEGGAVQRWLVAWGVIGVRVLVQLFVVLIFVSTFGIFSCWPFFSFFINTHRTQVDDRYKYYDARAPSDNYVYVLYYR